jgi:hypothetical protein
MQNKDEYKDPEYYEVKMSVEEMWQVLQALYGGLHPEEIITRWAYNQGGLPGHLMEIIEKAKPE